MNSIDIIFFTVIITIFVLTTGTLFIHLYFKYKQEQFKADIIRERPYMKGFI